MKIKIESNFNFNVSSLCYMPNGELRITLSNETDFPNSHYEYTAELGGGSAVEQPQQSLLEYARSFSANSHIKAKTRSSYDLMCMHLENYGDCPIDKVTTGYLQEFLSYLGSLGLKTGTVRLYFQKLACVLHNAYKNGLFDERIQQRVKRPKRDQAKRHFLTEAELRKMTRQNLPEKSENIRNMFMFSCMTGLRFSDVQGLRWKDVKRNGRHLRLEFHQQKTDTMEWLPLCEEAEALIRRMSRKGEYVFQRETNQKANTVLKRWGKMAGIKKSISFHCARHTFCVLLLTKDVPIYTVQQLMCHADVGTTKVYADLPNRIKTKAVNKLPKIGEREAAA